MLLLQFLVAAAALGLAGFTDEAKRFTIDFPQDWSAPARDANGNVQSNAPDGGIYCRANSVTLASLKDATQAGLNAQYREPFDKGTWAGVLTVDAAKMEISDARAGLVDDHVVQFVTIVFAADVMGAPMTARVASHILPGHMVNAGCFAPTQSFAGAKAIFDRVTTSLKPL